MAERVAFLGLGVMGYPMAGHLAAAGHDVVVYNRSRDKGRRWVEEHGGKAASTAAEAAGEADFVFCCVGDDPDVHAVALGSDGAFEAMRPGSIFVDHTTASAEIARKLHSDAQGRELSFLDAPVSGGQAGAENGALTVMVGGDASAYTRAEPLIAHYARCQRRLGPSGSGQLAKMVNQICIAGLLEGLAEGLHFALAAGLDAKAVVDVISQGAAQSWQMDNRHQTMLSSAWQHGFAVEWMRKDLRIALEEASRNGAKLPVAALVDQLYGEVEAMGGRRWDTSSLLARLEVARER